jgi:hypothetical protein
MPRRIPAAVRSRTLARLSDERGIALIMALGILFVLTITLGTVIYVTSASARHAEHSNASQKAYALAEAGLDNALAVLNVNYPGTLAYPGDPTLLTPAKTTTYDTGTATWSGTLTRLPLTSLSPWRWEWRITSTGTVQNPTGPGAAPVTRTATAIVPVVIPTTSPASGSGPLNFLYSGKDMWFQNSVHVQAPVYVTRDLHLESSAVIDGASMDWKTKLPKPNKAAIGHDLYLKNPQNQIGLTDDKDPTTPPDPRISEIHVVHQCQAKGDATPQDCGPSTADWDADMIFATVHDNVIPPGPPPFISFIPQLTASNMVFWYQNADLGPLAPCTTWTGSPPKFDTPTGFPDNLINLSATPSSAINLTPSGASYTCRSMVGSTILGELSWDHAAKLLTVKGTIFIDGSIYIAPGGTARYSGEATIVASGTFGMKGDTICATHPGYTGACNFTSTSPWDPEKSALVIVANGAAGAGGGQGDGSDFTPGEGIELKSAGFQGALIAKNSIRNETTTQMQGPMISVYDGVFAGQSNNLIFPPILFAPSGGGGIISDPPKPQLLDARNFAG